MGTRKKRILLSAHAKDQLRYRGGTEEEVITAIQSEIWQNGELGRLECRKIYPYQSEWNSRYYETKQMRPIFIETPDEIIVVTV
jgi:hypothetical protein